MFTVIFLTRLDTQQSIKIWSYTVNYMVFEGGKCPSSIKAIPFQHLFGLFSSLFIALTPDQVLMKLSHDGE